MAMGNYLALFETIFSCTSYCSVEPGWVATNGTLVTDVDTFTETCGDGLNWHTMACDDGNTNDGDGCSTSCAVETGWWCTGGTPTHSDKCYATCGDGSLLGDEECDDGNTVDYDGCSSRCTVEVGWTCDTTISPNNCTEICGDGLDMG